jgi:hypothetical protein
LLLSQKLPPISTVAALVRAPAGYADLASEASYEASRQAPATRRKKQQNQTRQDNKKRPEGRFSFGVTKDHFLPLPSSL